MRIKNELSLKILMIISASLMLGIILFVERQTVRGDEGNVTPAIEVSESMSGSNGGSVPELTIEVTQIPYAQVTQQPTVEPTIEPTVEPTGEPTLQNSQPGKITWKIETRQMLKSEGSLYSEPEQLLQGEGDLARLKSTLFPGEGGNNLIKGISPMLTLKGGVNKGEIIHVRVESNPSTGYQWEIIGFDPTELKKFDEILESNSRPQLGAFQTQQFTFEAIEDANTEIQFIYRRVFDPKKDTTHQVTIQAEFLEQIQDLTNPNRQKYYLRLPEKTNPPLQEGSLLGLPSSFDLREQGKVTSVKDQGYCGSCWAFAATSAMESALMFQKGFGAVNLSEQYLLSCNYDGMNCYDGGWDDYAQDYHKKNGYKLSNQVEAGAVLETVLPYADYYNQTSFSPSCDQDYQKAYWLQYSPRESWYVAGNWYTMPTVPQIKNAIYTYGAVSVGVCVDSTWYGYSGGIYTGSSSCTSPNHAVNLVGWNDSGQYWILKNSWGTGWGDNGYMYIRWGVNKVGSGANIVITDGSTLRPENDDFNYATNVVLSNNSYAASQFIDNATNDSDDPIIPCRNDTGYKTVWYRYVAPNNNPVTIDTQGSNYDTVLAVWQGTRGSLTNIACNDDSNNTLSSQIITSLTAGQTYYIEVAGFHPYSYGLLKLNVFASGPTSTPTRTPTPTSTPTPTRTPTPTPTYTPTPPLPPSPRLIAPSGTITSTNSPDYQWAEVAGALEYYLEVYKSSMFQPISTSVSTAYCNGGVCTYPGIRLASGIYQFRVKARNQTGWGSFSAWKVFIIDYRQALLPPPSLISPNGIINTSTPSFRWNKVTGAEEYDLLVISGLNGSVVINQRVSAANCSNDICSYATVSPLVKGSYSFKVRSIDSQGRAGSYSSPLTFRVNVSSLTAPVNLSVEEASTFRPLFKWDKVAGATRYYLLVYRDNNGTYPLRAYVYTYNCTNEVCSYRTPRNLYQGNYRFKVRAYNGKEWSAYSDWKTFILQ